MSHEFDPGPSGEPYVFLLRNYPGSEAYPTTTFRTEWGPIFYRGRLDGTARVLVIGQDPAAQEAITRRILVGEAGHRTQGLLAKLGIDRSYLMINAFLYSVYGQQGAERHVTDPAIAVYRAQWLEATLTHNAIEAVITLGHLADSAWTTWVAALPTRPAVAYAHLTHPTAPESSAGADTRKLEQATRAMLTNWNDGLRPLHDQLLHPDQKVPFRPYGARFQTDERPTIPEADMPAGLPDGMRSPEAWAQRTGATAAQKRRTITVTVPAT